VQRAYRHLEIYATSKWRGEFTHFPVSISLAQHDLDVATNETSKAGGWPVVGNLETQQAAPEAQTHL
jgi:hypothetical protein